MDSRHRPEKLERRLHLLPFGLIAFLLIRRCVSCTFFENLTEWKIKISRNETLKSHGMGLENRRNLSIGSVVFGIGLPLALEPSTNVERDINSEPANAHPAWIVMEDPVNSLIFCEVKYQRKRKIVPKLCWIQTPCRSWWEKPYFVLRSIVFRMR